MGLKISDKSSSQRMTITPEMAAQMLEQYNTHNRPLSQRRINKFVSEMHKGNWRYNPADAICFDVNLTLQNGQHRLWAVVEAEMSQDFQIATGTDPEAQDVMDQQRVRSTADQLSLSGIDSPKQLATIGRIYVHWRDGNITAMMDRPTTLDIKHWVAEANPDAVSFAVKTATDVSKLYKKVMSVGVVGAAAYSAYLKDPGAAEQFFADLVEGVGLDKGHPVLTLTKYLQLQGSAGRRFRDVHQLWLLISTWNSWRSGRTIGKIMSPSSFTQEQFPKMK